MPVRKQAESRGGRPRDSRVDDAIASAVRELLVEVGYARLTMDEVAALAGVGKAAIYRRHATKQEMIFEVATQGQFLAEPPARGSLRADLAALLVEVTDSMASAPPGVLPGLLADIHADPALLARFVTRYRGAQIRTLNQILDSALSRGELAGRPDVAVLDAVLVGPVFAWLYLLSEPSDRLPVLTSALLDAALALITAPAEPPMLGG